MLLSRVVCKRSGESAVQRELLHCVTYYMYIQYVNLCLLLHIRAPVATGLSQPVIINYRVLETAVLRFGRGVDVYPGGEA